MFYQKYRPKNFDEVFGNAQIVQSLKSALKQGKVSHAYLFYGPRGTGKTTMARLLAKALICDNYSDKTGACLQCEGCKQVLAGNYPDLIEIDAASNNSVENIRSINEKIHLSPTMGKLKFYIIDEVHMLSKGAFNALLKTLEEPPKNTYFVLATTEPDKVIDTIKSRCQQFEIKRATNIDVVQKLKYIVEKEGASITEEDLSKIAENSRGGFRDAETMLETVLVSQSSVDEVLNTVGVDFTVRFFDSVISQNSTLSIELINNVYASGKNLESWNKEILFYLRNVMLVTQNLENLVNESPSNIKLIKDQSSSFSKSFLLKCLKSFNQSLENLRVSYVPTLPLEIAVLEIVGEADVNSNLEDGPKSGGGRTSTIEAEKLTSNIQPSTSNKESEGIKVDNAKSKVISEEKTHPSSLPRLNSDKNLSRGHSALEQGEAIRSQDNLKNQNPEEKESVVDSAQSKVSSEENLISAVIQKEEPLTTEESKSHPTGGDIDPKLFKWEQYVKLVSQKRPSIATILKNCNYVGIQDGQITVEASFLFHKERLEFPSTKTVLIECATEHIGTSCGFTCILKKYAKKTLTDKNVSYVTVSEDQIPKFESKKGAKDKNGEFAIPLDDESFVASPVTVQQQSKDSNLDTPEEALQDFSGEFNL